MGLKFQNISSEGHRALFSNTSATETLTPENILLLQSRGFKIRNVRKTGNLRQSEIRRGNN